VEAGMIGVAFVGAGIVAEMHGRGVSATPQAKLMGVYDPNTSNARAIAKKFGGVSFKNLEELLLNDRIEAVHVITPPEHHVKVALACLRAGKHVLVEKPVAPSVSDIRKLEDAAARAGRVCMPAHNYIYAPPLRRAKRLIENGKLGKISSLWVIYNVFTPENIAVKYGGVLRAICTHHAYSLLYLLGKPLRVTATVSSVHYEKLTCEDQAMLVCEMPGGAIANLWCSFAAADPTSDPWTVVYKVLGTSGGCTYSWNEAQFADDGGPAWGLPCYEDGFANEIDHFVNRCILAGEQPLSTLADAADALRIIEAAEQSIKLKKVADTKHGKR
jgi:predicted dehydrogenase